VGYYQRTQTLAFSLILVVPLLLIYEVWLLQAQPDIVNAAGVMAHVPFEYLHQILVNLGGITFFSVSLLFNSVMVLILVVAFVQTKKDSENKFGSIPIHLLEAGVYGFFLGHVVVFVMNLLPSAGFSPLAMSPSLPQSIDPIMLSIGAGVYEELVFRLILVGGLYFLGILVFEKEQFAKAAVIVAVFGLITTAIYELAVPGVGDSWNSFCSAYVGHAPYVLGASILVLFAFCILVATCRKLQMTPKFAVACVSVLVGSLVFSAFHHIGHHGDALVWDVFTFRFLAGAILAAIFQFRGLAVAVYTHVIYDILVVAFYS
jgi:hypothetical protein